MASHQYVNCSNQVRNSSSVRTRRGYSKAQMRLFKILHIISSIPPSQNSKLEACPSLGDDGLGSFPKGLGIDLNLRFCSVPESGESESFAENGSDISVIEGNNRERGGAGAGAEPEAEAEVEVEVEAVHQEEKSVEVSEATDTQVQSFKIFNDGVDQEEAESKEDGKGNQGGVETMPFGMKRNECSDNNNNCLDLLIKAAKLVSAKDESNSEGLSGELRSGRVSEETGTVELEVEEGATKKRMQRWVEFVDSYGELEETPPVVRSKRGRNQALPHRFRDSVVEPLRRSGRPQRPSSTSTRKRLVGS